MSVLLLLLGAVDVCVLMSRDRGSFPEGEESSGSVADDDAGPRGGAMAVVVVLLTAVQHSGSFMLHPHI